LEVDVVLVSTITKADIDALRVSLTPTRRNCRRAELLPPRRRSPTKAAPSQTTLKQVLCPDRHGVDGAVDVGADVVAPPGRFVDVEIVEVM
jgi:hypothetical protein